MFRPGVNGLGNLLAFVTKSNVISDTIYKGGRDKYIKLENVTIQKDDGTLPDHIPPLFIGDPDHHRIRIILKPTECMRKMLDDYSHLVENVEFAFQIRRGGLIKNQELFKDTSPENVDFCTDATLEKFYDIMNKTLGNVYVTSDCIEIKHAFKKAWPDRVRILDEQPIHTTSVNESNDQWVSILEFFLLSKCPFVFGTGGNPKTGMSISTYGYMAALYGGHQYTFIFN